MSSKIAGGTSAFGDGCCACWGTGVFGGASCTGLNHGVLAVGLGEVRLLPLLHMCLGSLVEAGLADRLSPSCSQDEAGSPYWLIKNSW